MSFFRSGDAGVLERLYESMRRYLAFLEADQTNGLRYGGRYGDWVSLGARTDKLFIGTAYQVYVFDTFARIAAVQSEVRTGRKPGTRVMTVRSGTCGVPTLLVQPSVGKAE